MKYEFDNVKGGSKFVNVGPHPKDAIIYFGEKNWFLSNFYPCKVTYHGLKWLNTEAAFQAMKTTDQKLRERMSKMNPSDAKATGRTLRLRVDWEEIRELVMEDVLRLKFSQPKFAKWLLATENKMLIEGNWWCDTIWGVYEGFGQNILGKLHMKLRNELQDNDGKLLWLPDPQRISF